MFAPKVGARARQEPRIHGLAPNLSQSDNRLRVLDATDIVRLVGEHVALRPKGREMVCLCPFHDDHNPSMYVVPHKQIFHCFVCGAGGNAIDFVMKFHGMEFLEALEFLANRAGIELVKRRREPEVGDAGGKSASREELAQANATALRFFRAILAHGEYGRTGREMLDRRGISSEMVETFQIGLAPDRWDGLLQFIASKSLGTSLFLDAGLLKSRSEGDGYYDALRNRLVFPIFDQIGRVVGFGARRMNEADEPKYLNSPESRLFDKGSTLFGLSQASRAIQTARCAVITEGYTDVIACHQAGLKHVVATLGTALTPKHASILRRLCSSVVLLFDGDEAGQRAADRAHEVFFAEPVDVRIAVIPGGEDPDDLLKREGGVEALRAVIDGAKDVLQHRFNRLASRMAAESLAPGSAGRVRLIEEEIDRLVELGLRRLSPIMQQTVVRRITDLAGVDSESVSAALRKRGVGPRRGGISEVAASKPAALVSPLEHALGCLLLEPGLGSAEPDLAREILESAAYASPPVKAVAEAFSAAIAGEIASLASVLALLEESESRQVAAALAAEVDRITEGQHARLVGHWRQCVQRQRLETMRRPMAGDGARNGLDSIREAIERRRRIHETIGSDPLAIPRPLTAAPKS